MVSGSQRPFGPGVSFMAMALRICVSDPSSKEGEVEWSTSQYLTDTHI